MKKPILMILALCLLLAVFSACAKQNTSGPSPDVEAPEPTAEAEATEIDPDATAFSSVQGLVNSAEAARETDAQERTEAQALLAGLDEVWAPDAAFEGFALLGVEAQEDYLIYYYMPADGPSYDGFDYRRGVTVTVCTDPAVTLAQVCGELGLAQEPDGFAYDAEHQQLFFSQDGHTCSLQMPEGTADPEAMKAFCRIRRYSLD